MKYYKTKWDNLTADQKYALSKREENKLILYLIRECGFKHIIPTRDSIITQGYDKNLILPDLTGLHSNGKEYFIELKSKNRRMMFNDNGIDVDKAETYMEIQKAFKKRVLIVFIDDEDEWLEKYPNVKSWFKDSEGNCIYYGNWIDMLYIDIPCNPVTMTKSQNKQVVCFPLRNMKKIKDIFKDRQSILSFDVIT